MKILLCSQNPLDRRLGAPKVLIELSDALRARGAVCDLVGPQEIGGRIRDGAHVFSRKLRDFLRVRAASYDVAEYDHNLLPYCRSEFSPRTLMVARSILLVHYLQTIALPKPIGIGRRIRYFGAAPRRRLRIKEWVAAATETCREADCINVANPDDRDELVRHGQSPGKIIVLPYGLGAVRRLALARVEHLNDAPVVAFLGTFDQRKGAPDLPEIFQRISRAIPHARFLILGSGGIAPTVGSVLSTFPSRLRGFIDVVPHFDPDDLPQLLSRATVGICPSYFEAFGFSVLEMLAAGIPVVAYRSPGPTVMLSDEYLVPRGDRKEMSRRVLSLLQDADKLSLARTHARHQASRFNWEDIARTTLSLYDSARANLPAE